MEIPFQQYFGRKCWMLCLSLIVCEGLSAQLMSTRQYIDSFKFVAMQEMRAHGVPASITLGQGVLESASGNSKLAKNCNNHFGIKCRSNWTGKFCLADDDAKDECFRGYETAFDSYRDHSLFLKGGKRYFLLFELSATDYKGWANGLREAGYATNPNYGNILIGVIEKYRLSQYDSMVIFGEDFYAPGVTAPATPTEVNGIQAIMAKPGETPEQVAERYNMSTWQIYKYNDISKGDMLSPGEIIYLKPKRRRAIENNHTVKNGETMREISQKYGVKVKHLYKLNRLEPGLEVRPGEVINLKEKRETSPAILERNDNPNQVNAVDLILNQRSITQENKPKGTVYEVQAGETLQDIAQRMNVTALDLARWNNLDGYTVAAGQILVLRPNVKMSEETQVDYRNFMSNTGSSNAPRTHIVIRGETLFSIARLYRLSVDSLTAWNQLDGKPLMVDRKLYLQRVTGAASVKSDNNAQLYDAFHFVQPGETLYSISRKYSVTVDQVKSWNRLESNQIEVGQRLKVRQ
ncbi:MAG: LysM peptidoglycan-binding domain-containing protein [Bacteroidetes bacterium]|jgi:LysM repeat protein|nr:LysM peptidoglycan-binding domain-containing protein [Bacteroidota bacterium]